MPNLFWRVWLTGVFLAAGSRSAAPAPQSAPPVQVLDARGTRLTALVDGNTIRLKLSLSQAANAAVPVTFRLAGQTAPLAQCDIAAGATTCQTTPFPALGWAWEAGGARQASRVILAEAAGQPLGESAPLTVRPRPVVMVHGFNSNWTTWQAYLGPQGYLAPLGLAGYAVGDGQVPGVMNTGGLDAPLARTNTIAQNAGILGDYIRNVQHATGAEQVDVLVHSMGGMITRYYLDRVMTTRNVAQLIILGTPMAGSACAILPAALGLLLPATVEIQPSYMQAVFNPQITRRQGVPFHALAGTKLLKAVQSPCTPVPSDLVVPVASVKAIAMPVQEIALLHTELNSAPEVFTDFVQPLLQAPPDAEWQTPDPAPVAPAAAPQFTRVYTGHLQPGETQTVTITIDPGVTVATFALYDTSRSLITQVTGASGRTLALDLTANGVITVTDPAAMLYLGYGFAQPKAGLWQVALQTSAATPAAGADYALAAQFNGGAWLQADLDQVVPPVQTPLRLQARLTVPEQAVTLTRAEARLRQPNGTVTVYPLTIQGDSASAALTPALSGVHSVEVDVSAQTAAGLVIDRAAYLAFDAQPAAGEVTQSRWIAGGAALLAVAGLAGTAVWLRRRRAARR